MDEREIDKKILESRRALDRELARMRGRLAATVLIRWSKIFLFWYGVYSLLKWVF
jgi:hypothetical protein